MNKQETVSKGMSQSDIGLCNPPLERRVAAIVLNYNSAADTRKCVDHLSAQQGVDLRIIVVDNCSPRLGERGEVERLCRERGVTFIAAEANLGYNAGNNLGLRRAHSEGCRYALIANPDMEFPDPRYIATLIAEMQAHDAVLAGSDIHGPEGGHQSPMAPDSTGGSAWSSWRWMRDIIVPSKRGEHDWIDRPDMSHEATKVSGCCLLLDLDWLAADGFLDEGVFLYCEEAILARRVEMGGRRGWYTTATHAIHRHIKSAKGDPRPRLRAWRNSRLYYIGRYSHRGPVGRLIERASIITYTTLLRLAATIRRK